MSEMDALLERIKSHPAVELAEAVRVLLDRWYDTDTYEADDYDRMCMIRRAREELELCGETKTPHNWLAMMLLNSGQLDVTVCFDPVDRLYVVRMATGRRVG